MFWYVIEKNKVIAKCSYEPDSRDLKSRRAVAIKSEKDLELEEAEFKNDKVVKHQKTKEETALEKEREKAREVDLKIQARMKKIAIRELKQEDPEFEEPKCEMCSE